MTLEEFFAAMVGPYWWLTTGFLPELTFFYAWFTGQVGWCIFSFIAIMLVRGNYRSCKCK